MKRKILFLIPSLNGGGAERTLINLLHKLDYTKFEVDLVIVLKDGVYLQSVPKEVNCIYMFQNKMLVRILAWLQKKIGFDYILKRSILNENIIASLYGEKPKVPAIFPKKFYNEISKLKADFGAKELLKKEYCIKVVLEENYSIDIDTLRDVDLYLHI